MIAVPLAATAPEVLVSPFVPAGAWLLFLMAAGILLWALGGRLLRPGLALIGLMAGLPVGIWIGGAVAPEVPSVIFAAGGALAGLVLACLSYTLALASVTAALTGILALMAAWTAVDMGLIDAGRAAARIDSTTGAIASADPMPKSFDTLTRVLLGAAAPLGANPDASSAGVAAARADESRDHAEPSPRLVDRAQAAIEQHWSTMPQPMRTLLVASLAAGVVVGFLLGLLCSDVAARIVTSLAGSLLLLVAGIPLLSALLGRSEDLLPPRPGAWFVAIALLTIIGFGVQRAIQPPRSPEPRSA